MINFFRKTRKKLADDNKPMKYMRYAIGEIILVVIGILIALQINNWNEERKVSHERDRLLINLKTEFKHNKEVWLADSLRWTKSMQVVTKLLKYTGPDPNIEAHLFDSLLSLDLDPIVYNPKMKVYNELMQQIKIIKNDHLRELLYQWQVALDSWRINERLTLKNRDDRVEFMQEQIIYRNIDNNYYLDGTLGESKFSIDNRNVLKDFRFENHLENLIYTRLFGINKWEELRENIDGILVELEK